ncbi:hypothetical protein T484DRAFT_1895095 [Baffinella frigidus]|nr:hypothetical protein T484DRAFT_1895095 [Cryptophyta sp. CCMP2293]
MAGWDGEAGASGAMALLDCAVALPPGDGTLVTACELLWVFAKIGESAARRRPASGPPRQGAHPGGESPRGEHDRAGNSFLEDDFRRRALCMLQEVVGRVESLEVVPGEDSANKSDAANKGNTSANKSGVSPQSFNDLVDGLEMLEVGLDWRQRRAVCVAACGAWGMGKWPTAVSSQDLERCAPLLCVLSTRAGEDSSTPEDGDARLLAITLSLARAGMASPSEKSRLDAYRCVSVVSSLASLSSLLPGRDHPEVAAGLSSVASLVCAELPRVVGRMDLPQVARLLGAIGTLLDYLSQTLMKVVLHAAKWRAGHAGGGFVDQRVWDGRNPETRASHGSNDGGNGSNDERRAREALVAGMERLAQEPRAGQLGGKEAEWVLAACLDLSNSPEALVQAWEQPGRAKLLETLLQFTPF